MTGFFPHLIMPVIKKVTENFRQEMNLYKEGFEVIKFRRQK